MLGSMLFFIVLSSVVMVIQAGFQVQDNCVLKFKDFKDNVLGKNWISVYMIDDSQASPGSTLKRHVHGTVLPDDTLMVYINKWNEPERSCEYSSFSFERTNFGIEKDRAEYKLKYGPTVVRYVSSHPNKYTISNVCIDGPLCTRSVYAIQIEDQRTDATCLDTGSSDIVLDNVLWQDINDDLKKCYDRQFGDNKSPPIEWIWKGRTECPPQPPS